ncbi:MAG TPA: asparagine synthetase B family protein [Polyangiales bacterium]|nr:asparagine synthetase B family protein [Polyangiales bacterium]
MADLASAAQRSGRIGGIWSPSGAQRPEALAAMGSALGRDARLLSGVGTIADADACWLDGAPLHDFSGCSQRLREIDGGFALAFQNERGALRLACDPIGHRSLYYSRLPDGTIVYASTLHGVLGSGLVPRRLCARAVPFFLTFAYVPGTQTLVEGVQVLPAGHVLDAGERGIELQAFWQLPATPPSWRDEAELTAALRAELEQAVFRSLPPPDAHAGATLSGGVDSSLVLALLRRAHAGELTCYSVAFGPEHANELAWSGLVAAHCGVRQQVVEISAAEVAAELDSTVAALSQPNGDPLTVPNALLFRRAAERGSVLFNGEGGDPCFGGPKNAPMLLAELLDADPDPHDRHARARSYLRAHQKCYDDLPELLRPELRAELSARDPLALERCVTPWFEDERWPSLLDKLMAINVAFKGAHHILPKVDHLSFAPGVCPRSTLFDRRVVELSFQIPPALKRKGAVEKHLLKRAVRDLLPASVIERPKSGMLVPVEAWFRGPLLAFARERLLDGLTRWELFDRRWLERLLDGTLGGLRPRRGVKIWLLLTLEAWLRGTLRAD